MSYNSCWKSFTANADEDSLKNLFVKAYGDLYTYGRKISGDTGVVKDAIQEVFLNLWKYRNNLNAEARAVPYLFRALRNEIIRIKKKTIPYVPFVHENASMVFRPDEFLGETLEGYEKKLVIDALNSLPPRQKEILYLKFYENVSYEDIAVILGIRYQSVINQSFRGISKLREYAALKDFLFSE